MTKELRPQRKDFSGRVESLPRRWRKGVSAAGSGGGGRRIKSQAPRVHRLPSRAGLCSPHLSFQRLPLYLPAPKRLTGRFQYPRPIHFLTCFVSRYRDTELRLPRLGRPGSYYACAALEAVAAAAAAAIAAREGGAKGMARKSERQAQTAREASRPPLAGERRHAHAIFHRRSGARHGDVACCRHGLEGGAAKREERGDKMVAAEETSEWGGGGEKSLSFEDCGCQPKFATDGSLIQKRMLSRAPRFAFQKRKKCTKSSPIGSRHLLLKLVANLTPCVRLNCSLWRITYYLDFGAWSCCQITQSMTTHVQSSVSMIQQWLHKDQLLMR
ncbi:hypothetical protein E2320_006001 [Naja naja]|nr:hypothetical protein E2320_006001 [Naja naja]